MVPAAVRQGDGSEGEALWECGAGAACPKGEAHGETPEQGSVATNHPGGGAAGEAEGEGQPASKQPSLVHVNFSDGKRVPYLEIPA